MAEAKTEQVCDDESLLYNDYRSESYGKDKRVIITAAVLEVAAAATAMAQGNSFVHGGKHEIWPLDH